jgi:hypothetical protein
MKAPVVGEWMVHGLGAGLESVAASVKGNVEASRAIKEDEKYIVVGLDGRKKNQVRKDLFIKEWTRR